MPQFLNIKQLYERLGASRAALSRWLTEWRMRHQVVDLIHRLLPWVKERLILLSRWLFRTWSPRWNTFAVVGSAVFIVVPLLGTLLGYKPSTVILWATGLVVLAYTIEAYRMRLELVRQNEIAIQPVLITTIEEIRTGTGKTRRFKNQIVIRNIGRGPALFIKVNEMDLFEEADVHFVAKFDTVDYLEPGKDTLAKVTLWSHAPKEVQERFDFVSNLDPRYATRTFQVVISYEDIASQKRESVMQMGKDGVRLLRHQWVYL